MPAKFMTDVVNTSTSSDLARACPWRVPLFRIDIKAILAETNKHFFSTYKIGTTPIHLVAIRFVPNL